MNDTINKIRLDLGQDTQRTSISICRGDTLSRTIYVTLINSGYVYELPRNGIATLFAKKPDGKKVYNDCAIQGNEIVYSVTNQLIVVAGDVECQIKVTSDDGTEFTTPIFILRVYEKLFDEAILESTNEYTALQAYCIRAETAAKRAEELVAGIK